MTQYFIPVFCLFEEFHEVLVSYPIENKVLKNKSCLVFSSSLFFVPGALMEQFLNNDLMVLFPCKRCFLQSKVGSLFSSLALTFINTTCILVVVVELYLFHWKHFKRTMHKLLEIIFSPPYTANAILENIKCNLFFPLTNDELIINSLSQRA